MENPNNSPGAQASSEKPSAPLSYQQQPQQKMMPISSMFSSSQNVQPAAANPPTAATQDNKNNHIGVHSPGPVPVHSQIPAPMPHIPLMVQMGSRPLSPLNQPVLQSPQYKSSGSHTPLPQLLNMNNKFNIHPTVHMHQPTASSPVESPQQPSILKDKQEIHSNSKEDPSSNGETPDKSKREPSKNKNSASSPTDGAKKPRKRRKTYSCESCRNLKTRCDFQPFLAKCHRCIVLGLDCSLTKEREQEILEALETKRQNSATTLADKPQSKSHQESSSLSLRMDMMERNLNKVDQKLNLILSFLQNQQGDFKSPSANPDLHDEYSSRSNRKHSLSNGLDIKKRASYNFQKDLQGHEYSGSKMFTSHGIISKDPPFKLLDDIDRSLFSTKANTTEDAYAKSQRPFVAARTEFMKFFNKHEQLCYTLSREFLVKAHFWIIPGGVKKIDRTYVQNHAFITSVFTIIAMGFDENNKYEKEQEELYPIVERLITNTLTMFDKLIDHDIEAILYCCMFSIARKSKRYRQLKFNSLILCNFALNSLLTIINFHAIKENVSKEVFHPLDLFHLRILNSLTAIKLEYSVGYGNFSIQDDQVKEFNDLTAKFPQANFGDEIKLSEINLGDITNDIFLHFESYTKKCMQSFKKKETKMLKFDDLQYWLKNWHELSCKDGGGVLLFTFDFYHIIICRSILREFCDKKTFDDNVNFFKICLKTISEYCFSLLNGFLKLPSSLIKGAPTITLHQTIYSCLTLCDFLHCFEGSERQKILNMCTKIYWHLNTIGEKLNEATLNVGMIIKNLIDSSKANNNNNSDPDDPEELFKRITEGSRHSNVANKFSTHAQKPVNKTTSTEKNTKNRAEFNSKSPASGGQTASAVETESLSDSVVGDTPGSTATTETVNNTAQGSTLNIPDVEQFQSFEDFFQDFFYNLKPTSQDMFSGMN